MKKLKYVLHSTSILTGLSLRTSQYFLFVGHRVSTPVGLNLHMQRTESFGVPKSNILESWITTHVFVLTNHSAPHLRSNEYSRILWLIAVHSSAAVALNVDDSFRCAAGERKIFPGGNCSAEHHRDESSYPLRKVHQSLNASKCKQASISEKQVINRNAP